ncbi:FUSC family protein [Clostridium fallax]|uniref:Aromatic acid exporter family member 1 n=1 Tax=Clostridium fallax TaxID=1533 RepID=A0A1M4TAH5_9CLOT|nr:aromatic acid exporter family protein [Clostridium fallax]SHE41410.1 Aromatic acid exporter family member 1 [Clostridium fallax]SQB22673.1 putative transmembrane protein [Clostridium fallax]
MEKSNLFSIGGRNLKTAFSVLLCVLLFEIINRPFPFYACIAAVICVKDTWENSFTIGKNRLIGTFIGGIIGIVFIFISQTIHFFNTQSIITAVGIIVVIHICNLMNRPGSTVIACIVFLAIMVNLKGTGPYLYAINRILDTFIGVIIALLVNRYIAPVKKSSK